MVSKSFVVVWLLLFVLAAALPAVAMPSVSETRVFSLAEDTVGVDLRGFNGSIYWLEADGPARVELELEVRGFLQGAMERMLQDIVVRQETDAEGTLTIEAEAPAGRFGATQASAVFRFYGPADAVDTFRGVTSNGSLGVERFAADLDLRTSNGGVDLGTGRGVVDIRTSNGRVELEHVELTGSSSVRTSNGRISGRVLLPDTGEHTFRTSNGSVELQLSGNLGGAFALSTSNGTAQLRLADIDLELEGRDIRYGHAEEGPVLTVETSNGNIRVTDF